jgi:hypothetical protein
MNPNLFEHIAANSMPTVRFVTPESLPPSPSPEHPNSDSGSGSWDTDSGSDGDTDSGQVVLDYVDNNATFSTWYVSHIFCISCSHTLLVTIFEEIAAYTL